MPSVELGAVAEVCFQSWTHLERESPRVNAEVPTIEELVNVSAKQETVADPVLALFCDGPNVSRVERRCDASSGDRAAPLICLEHECLEGSLCCAPGSVEARN